MHKPLYFFTFEEVAEGLTGSAEIKIDATPTFLDLFSYLFANTQPIQEYWTTGNGATLFKALYIKNFEDVVATSESLPVIVTDYQKLAKEFGKKVFAIWSKTHDYYEALLSYYSELKTHLLEGLKTTNEFTNKYNDTPENQGQYGADDYTSNITNGKSMNIADNLSPMQKLDEIKRLYDDIFTRWVNEFDGLFVSRLNYENECF